MSIRATRAIPEPGPARPGFLLRASCTGTLALALAQPAIAQVTDSASYLARMDADHDGRVSLLEYQDWLGYAFDAMDRDGDGTLASAELPGGRGAPLTRSEHRARLAATFARQDRDHDGYLDARELAAPLR